MRPLRIAAFGFRSYPPRAGSAGADKFAMELLPRLAARGHRVTAYNRLYPGMEAAEPTDTQGVDVLTFRTTNRSGFDTFLHSAKVTYDIIRHNRADVVHIQNGGNSVFGAVLRLFGKKTFLSQDGLDWKRDKWSWYAKVFLWFSSLLTAHVHNAVIFDNIYAREAFETRFKKKYDFIPFGADVKYDEDAERVLQRMGLDRGEYFLFVGRFIPDKGCTGSFPGSKHWTRRRNSCSSAVRPTALPTKTSSRRPTIRESCSPDSSTDPRSMRSCATRMPTCNPRPSKGCRR